MDPATLSFITFVTIVLGAWAAGIVVILGNIMWNAKKQKRTVRTEDKRMFLATIILMTIAFVVVFIYPGLIHMIPSTVAFIELSSVPVLGYMSEVAYKHWRRMPETNVDHTQSV